jgi:phosphoserine phosphatase RsbU/P
MSEGRLKVSDFHGTRAVLLDKPVFTIGRRSTADLKISLADVSKEHAEVVREGDHYVLHDRGSRYGTFVNGQAVTRHPLTPGDTITLGRNEAVTLVFESDTTSITSLSDTTADVGGLRLIASILNCLRALGSGRVLGDVLALVIDSALDVTKAERGFVMLANEQGELRFTLARRSGRVMLPGTSFATSIKIPHEVFTTGQGQMVPDLMERESGHGDTIAAGIRHVICVPLRVGPMTVESSPAAEARVIGVLYLDGRERRTMCSTGTLSSLEGFATQAALAIESARLYAEAAEKARLDRDLRVAAEIQRSLNAQPTYAGATCDVAAVSRPCRTIGGDFYDFLDFPDGSFALALGDVAGKGAPAALLAAALQSQFIAQVMTARDPAKTMASINTALLRRPIAARFATMFHGVLAPDGRFSYCNAGQEPPLFFNGHGVNWLDVGGPVLGLLPSATYESATVQLEPNDTVTVYSDGVTEARNVEDEEFGRERMVDVLAHCLSAKPEAALEVLVDAVRDFSRGAPQADDITALILRYHGRSG